MSKIGTIFAFVAGAGIGSCITWHYMNRKFEEKVNEEIESVKEVYGYHSNNVKDLEEAKEAAEKAKEKPSINEYTATIGKLDYTSYSEKPEQTETKDEDESDDVPYVISPDEFGEIPEYTQISLSYFADHIVADDDYEILEDVEDVIGFDSLNHIGEYEDDAVHVRNDRLKCDYEILVDHRKYRDVIKSRRPRLTEE